MTVRKSTIKRIVKQAMLSAIKTEPSEEQISDVFEYDLSLAEIMRGSTTNNVNQSLDTLITKFMEFNDSDLREAATALKEAIININDARNSVSKFLNKIGA